MQTIYSKLVNGEPLTVDERTVLINLIACAKDALVCTDYCAVTVGRDSMNGQIHNNLKTALDAVGVFAK